MKATKPQTLRIRLSKPDQLAVLSAALATQLTMSAWARSVILERLAELRARKVIA